MTDRTRTWLRVGLIGAAVADLLWIVWPWVSYLAMLYWPELWWRAAMAYEGGIRGSGSGGIGSGSVSAGISEMLLYSLLPAPLACHGLAQCAHAGPVPTCAGGGGVICWRWRW